MPNYELGQLALVHRLECNVQTGDHVEIRLSVLGQSQPAAATAVRSGVERGVLVLQVELVVEDGGHPSFSLKRIIAFWCAETQ